MSSWLTPEVVSAVLRHMNSDHTDDSLLIVRALGGLPDATSAVMSGLDLQLAHFSADVPDEVGGASSQVVVPWSAPLADRAQIRAEVVQMYEKACAQLGMTPRAH